MCHNRINTSTVTTPFIYSKECGPGMEIATSGPSSSSHRNALAVQQQKRARTPNIDNMTYSNREGGSNSAFSTNGFTALFENKHSESHALPS